MTVTPAIDPHRLTPWDSKNVWMTLAKAINQTSFCVSLALPEQSFILMYFIRYNVAFAVFN